LREVAEISSIFDKDEYCDIQKEVIKNDERIEILRKYHCKKIREEYDKIIEIKICEYFNVHEMEVLQLEVLKFLHKKRLL
jgi:hypothetical protein